MVHGYLVLETGAADHAQLDGIFREDCGHDHGFLPSARRIALLNRSNSQYDWRNKMAGDFTLASEESTAIDNVPYGTKSHGGTRSVSNIDVLSPLKIFHFQGGSGCRRRKPIDQIPSSLPLHAANSFHGSLSLSNLHLLTSFALAGPRYGFCHTLYMILSWRVENP